MNLGTLTLGTPGNACAWEDLPVPEGYNVKGDQAWYVFTGSLNAACPQPGEIYVTVAPGTVASGYFGVAATVAGVNPDIPFDSSSTYVPWPADGGTSTSK